MQYLRKIKRLLNQRWSEENRNYFSEKETDAFWGCVVLGTGDIAFLIVFISDKNMIGILITIALEIFFIIYGIYLKRFQRVILQKVFLSY